MREPFILVVDDETHWADLAEQVFVKKGFRFVHLLTPQEALSFLASEEADFLLVNSSLVSEWEDLRKVLDSKRVKKIVILSGVHSISLAVEAFRRGMDYGDKPFGEEGLATLADYLLASTEDRRVEIEPALSEKDSCYALVVEDRPEWQRIFSNVLAAMPRLEVTVVDNYADAASALAGRQFHIVIADIRLLDEDSSNIDGFVLLRDIYESGADVSVIMTSGFAKVELAREAMFKYRAFDFFLKSPDSGLFELERFRESVRRAIHLHQRSLESEWRLSWEVQDA